jgi:hypothetical protein
VSHQALGSNIPTTHVLRVEDCHRACGHHHEHTREARGLTALCYDALARRYAMEISPPTNTNKDGGLKLNEDGTFSADGSVPPEMMAMLAEIQKAKAARQGSVTEGGKEFARLDSYKAPPPSGPPPPPGGGMPPPPSGPPPAIDLSDPADPHKAALIALSTQKEAELSAGPTSEAMDTLLLMSAKDSEISKLKDELADAHGEIAALKEARATMSAPMPSVSAAPPPPSLGGSPSAAEERADKAEAELADVKQAMTKLQAKLNAVRRRARAVSTHRSRTRVAATLA